MVQWAVSPSVQTVLHIVCRLCYTAHSRQHTQHSTNCSHHNAKYTFLSVLSKTYTPQCTLYNIIWFYLDWTSGYLKSHLICSSHHFTLLVQSITSSDSVSGHIASSQIASMEATCLEATWQCTHTCRQKNHTASWDKKNHATPQNKNHATTRDKKIMPPLTALWYCLIGVFTMWLYSLILTCLFTDFANSCIKTFSLHNT